MILEKYLSYFAPVILFPLPVFKITHHTSYVKHHICVHTILFSSIIFYPAAGRRRTQNTPVCTRRTGVFHTFLLILFLYAFMLICLSDREVCKLCVYYRCKRFRSDLYLQAGPAAAYVYCFKKLSCFVYHSFKRLFHTYR